MLWLMEHGAAAAGGEGAFVRPREFSVRAYESDVRTLRLRLGARSVPSLGSSPFVLTQESIREDSAGAPVLDSDALIIGRNEK